LDGTDLERVAEGQQEDPATGPAQRTQRKPRRTNVEENQELTNKFNKVRNERAAASDGLKKQANLKQEKSPYQKRQANTEKKNN